MGFRLIGMDPRTWGARSVSIDHLERARSALSAVGTRHTLECYPARFEAAS